MEIPLFPLHQGLRNFEYAFSTDPFFLNSLIVTLKYALVAVPFNLLVALPIAIGLNQVTRLRAVFRSAFFLPTVASAVGVTRSLPGSRCMLASVIA